MAYVKLDTGILDSTLWLSDSDVRVVFITMLAMAKADGMCDATAPGIARRSNLSLEATRRALSELEAPDEDSRSLDQEGRRVVRVDGGYFIVNYEKYRQRDHTAAERKRRERAEKKALEAQMSRRDNRDNGENVTPVTPDVTQAEAQAEADTSTSPDGDESSGKPDGPPPCPHKEIIGLYHEILPELPAVRTWEGNRRSALQARWKADPKHQDLDWWRRYFRHVRRSAFLMGQADPPPGRKRFRATLEWLVKYQNFAKVLEGHYHDD